ncbi:MAG: 1,4-dihydroxy-2-naphthoate polyprenyltransferase [Desulfobulbaceae bacterium]|jgi:1,4-dihydroxy-2-naphthoate octaprenyltransferase|nr:1,4-dihydroxy-2-naphthoate polyprenyltransferase [Desulfobulbaceae bacterium]
MNTPWRLWLLAARPKTLPAAIAPVVVGSAVAWGEDRFNQTAMAACLFFALIMQIAANLANDYFDWRRGIDANASERLGPKRFCQSGLIAPSDMRRAVALTVALAALPLLFLISRGGWPIVLLGMAAIAATLTYSGGPYPLASHALGEAAAFVFFGLVAVGGSAFLIGGHYHGLAFTAALPPGLLIAALMVVNNFRDMASDMQVGKRTLAVRLGRDKSILLYRGLLIASYLVPLAMARQRGPFLCLPLLALPLAWRLGRRIAVWQGQRINDLLAATAQFTLTHSLLFAAGIVLS